MYAATIEVHSHGLSSPVIRFAEVVKAYEVLSDEKRRQSYDLKRKFTGSAPFGGGRSQKAGAGAGGSSGGASSWRRTAEYGRAREEASRRWKEQNPSPEEIGEGWYSHCYSKG